jgi:16S rRNA G527 N7-methylase RsmG
VRVPRALDGELPNVRVVCGRAEEQPVDTWGVAVAKALAPPPVAAEWCLPLVAPGGAAVLYVGPTAQVEQVARWRSTSRPS